MARDHQLRAARQCRGRWSGTSCGETELACAPAPHRKRTVETVNGAADRMLVAGFPRYPSPQKLANGRPVDPGAPALTFEAVVAELL